MEHLTTELGSELEKGGVRWRVIRITKQDSLNETADGELTVVSEHLLELKDGEGHIKFECLSTTRTPFTGPMSTIKAPEPLTWKE